MTYWNYKLKENLKKVINLENVDGLAFADNGQPLDYKAKKKESNHEKNPAAIHPLPPPKPFECYFFSSAEPKAPQSVSRGLKFAFP